MKNILLNSLNHLKVLCLVSGITLFFNACEKEKEPAPTGRLIFYTELDQKEYDTIDVYVNKKYVGKITASASKRPRCDEFPLGQMVRVDIPAGDFVWSAKQFLNGEEIDDWDERSEKLDANECEHISLVE